MQCRPLRWRIPKQFQSFSTTGQQRNGQLKVDVPPVSKLERCPLPTCGAYVGGPAGIRDHSRCSLRLLWRPLQCSGALCVGGFQGHFKAIPRQANKDTDGQLKVDVSPVSKLEPCTPLCRSLNETQVNSFTGAVLNPPRPLGAAPVELGLYHNFWGLPCAVVEVPQM